VRRLAAAAAVLTALMLVGIGTAVALAAHEQHAPIRSIVLRGGAGPDVHEATMPAHAASARDADVPSPEPSPAATPKVEPTDAAACAMDRSEADEHQDADEPREADETDDCQGQDMNGDDRQHSGPDQPEQKSQKGENGQGGQPSDAGKSGGPGHQG
jgi:hypothetical protein